MILFKKVNLMQQESFQWTKPIMWGGALFSMFFGAGNMIYSIWVGYLVDRSNYWPGVLGFILTAVLFPLIGLIGIWSQKGCVFTFLAPIKSRNIKLCILVFILLVWGPFGAIPRAILLTFKSLEPFLPQMPLALGHGLLCVTVALLVTNPKSLIQVFGRWLMPSLLLAALGLFIVSLTKSSTLALSSLSSSSMAIEGMNMGYQTMDGLGAIFFGKLLVEMFAQEKISKQHYRKFFAVTFISALVMLTAVYMMLIEAAARMTEELVVTSPILLMMEMSRYALGPKMSLVIALLLTGAALSTAIALALIFTDFLHINILKKTKREWIVAAIMSLSFGVSLLGIEGIMKLSGPFLQILYPSIIALSIYLIFNHIQKDPLQDEPNIIESEASHN
jgi:LIVCS family branched-chain amino acid:cation transporter